LLIVNPLNEVEILNQWEVDGAVISTHHCWSNKLVLIGNNNTVINSLITLTVMLKDWQDNMLTHNSDVLISVTSDSEVYELELEIINGQIDFEFVSESMGTFIIKALMPGQPCDIGLLEVTVS